MTAMAAQRPARTVVAGPASYRPDDGEQLACVSRKAPFQMPIFPLISATADSERPGGPSRPPTGKQAAVRACMHGAASWSHS